MSLHILTFSLWRSKSTSTFTSFSRTSVLIIRTGSQRGLRAQQKRGNVSSSPPPQICPVFIWSSVKAYWLHSPKNNYFRWITQQKQQERRGNEIVWWKEQQSVVPVATTMSHWIMILLIYKNPTEITSIRSAQCQSPTVFTSAALKLFLIPGLEVKLVSYLRCCITDKTMVGRG